MTGYENGCLPVLEEELEDLVSNWGTDEMLELMAQCEFALSHCDGRIEQLKARGMKRLYNIITGINRRNRMRVLDNIYQIQKISFDIQKILLRRIDWVNSGLIRLNDKLDTQTYWTQDVIKGLLRKMADTTIDLKLLHWQNEVKNRRMEDNRKYIEVSDGLKVLLIVSDLFDIVHNRTDLISGPYLETVLDNLALKETISVADFYEDIIRERECLSLYIRDNFCYKGDNVSEYGHTVCKIADFFQDENVKAIADSTQESVDDVCRRIFARDGRKAKTIDLCRTLLEDLGNLYSYRQISAEQSVGIIIEQQDEADSEQQKGQEIQKKKRDADECEEKDASRKYSLLRLTPEGLWLFRDGGVICSPIEHEYDYSFSDEKLIKSYLDSNSPYMVTAPTGYFEECIPEIKNFLLEETEYLPLADYYMYLWFQYKSADVQKNRKVAVIEYYAHRLYVSGYEVNASCTGYRKGFSNLKIRYNKARGNIIKDIRSEFNRNFSMVDGDDILMFCTFTADRHIDKKLMAKDVKAVDDNWENILKTDNDALGKIIRVMVGKNSDQR